MSAENSARAAKEDGKSSEGAVPSAQTSSKVNPAHKESGLFSSEAVLSILKLILAGSPLPEILAIIARLVESEGKGMFCTIWLPDDDGKHLHCVAAPSLSEFIDNAGRTVICEKGASCGTAVFRREPVYVTDILTDPRWDDYRHSVSAYGFRSSWSRPLFTREGKVLGTNAIHLTRNSAPPRALRNICAALPFLR